MPRLDELLARNLGISKTAARRLCEAERVRAADGTPLVDFRQPWPAASAGAVLVDGATLPLFERALVMLHKPVGVVTALRDARHATAYALLRGAPLFPELRPVGRLDLDSSGLLLWATEGAVIQRLTHPKHRVPRTYEAVLARPVDVPAPRALDLRLADGHRPEILDLRALPPGGGHPAIAKAAAAGAGRDSVVTITLVGGAYHEVRRIFAALGSHVLVLCRTRFGPYALPPDLPPGAWRPLTDPDQKPEPTAATK